MKNKYEINYNKALLPVPFTYFDKEGSLQTVCFFLPIPSEEGISTHGVDIKKLVSNGQCFILAQDSKDV